MEALTNFLKLTCIGLACGACVTLCVLILGFLATHPPVKKNKHSL